MIASRSILYLLCVGSIGIPIGCNSSKTAPSSASAQNTAASGDKTASSTAEVKDDSAARAQVLRILERESRDRHDELQKNMKEMLDFKQAHPNLSDGKPNIILEQLAALSDSLGTAHLDVLATKANYDDALAISKDPAKMEQRMKQGESKQQFDAYLGTSSKLYETAKRDEAEISGLYDKQQKLALELNQQISQYQMMEIESQRLQRDCDLVDARIKEVESEHGTGSADKAGEAK